MSAKKKRAKPGKVKKEKPQTDEDETALKEEEEARLIAEREEKERLEREQKEEEEREKLEQKDRERREDELNELRYLLEENQTAVNAWEATRRENAKWDRYLLCDGSPNPAVQPEINAFISLWKEDPEVQIQPLLQHCAMALRLIDELDLLLREEPIPSVALLYQDTVVTLQSLVHDKLLQASEEILKLANEQSDIETGNMQTVVQDDNVTLCLWANLNKNPRVKGYQFKEVGLGFELPRQLALSDIGVRILHTHYDHLSDLSRLAQTRGRRPEVERVEEELGTVTPLARTPEGTEGGHTGEQGDETQRLQQEDNVQSLRPKRKKEQGREGQTETVVAGLTFPGGGADEPDSGPTAAEPMTDTTDVHVVNLQQYTPLGGVFYCDAFYLPPQSHRVNGWEMRELIDTGLQVFPYPSEQSQVHSSVTGNLKESSTHSSPPIGVSVRLPDSVIFLEEPQVARWDPVGRRWRTDCISEPCYQRQDRSLSFNTASFSAFTLLQETHLNMPFRSWELRPLGQDSALLTITTAHTQVSITVEGNQCMLQMEQARELTPILGRPMTLSALQAAMRRSGINIFVNEYSEKYVDVNAKEPLIEHAAYEQMALVSSAFAFSRSRWNAQCEQHHLVLQVCELLEAGPVPTKAWSLYLLGAQRSHRLKMTESSPVFSADLAEGSEFHSTFLHMLKDTMSAEGWGRVSHAHPLYTDTVQRLLSSTRLLTFS